MKAVAFALIEFTAVIGLLFLSRRAANIRGERTHALWFYFVFIAMALPPLLLLPLGHGPNVPFFGAAGMVAWVLLGALWLARRYPGIAQPDWVLRPWWIPDWTLILITGLCVIATFFG